MERLQRLVDRCLRVVAVQLIEVDVVGAQPAERCVDRIHDVAPAAARVPGLESGGAEHFCRDDELVSPALQPPPQNFLRGAGELHSAAKWIGVGRVQERHAPVRCTIQNRYRRRLVDLQAEGHRPQAES